MELGKQLSSEKQSVGVSRWIWSVGLTPKVCEPKMDTSLKPVPNKQTNNHPIFTL